MLIGLFAAAISAHVIDLLFRVDPSPPLKEKRIIQSWPGWDGNWAAFPQQFEEYYGDHFGFRNTLVRWHSMLKVFGLGVSSSDRVVVGKAGWLFLDSDVEVHRSARALSEEELGGWQDGLEEVRRRWSARGASFLLVVVPGAPTVYPEYLPSWAGCLRPTTMLDQFLDHLTVQSDVATLDLRPAMMKVKSRFPLYRRTDTHWNDYGAYAAYRAIIGRLRVGFPQMGEPLGLARFIERSRERPGGDLAGLLALRHHMRALVPELERRDPPRARRVHATFNRFGEPVWMRFRIEESDQPSALVIHDSFTYAGLYPLLVEHFSQIDFFWRREKTVVPSRVELPSDLRPDVVIQEIAERMLLLDAARSWELEP